MSAPESQVGSANDTIQMLINLVLVRGLADCMFAVRMLTQKARTAKPSTARWLQAKGKRDPDDAG